MAVWIFLRPLNLRCGNKAAVFAGYAKRFTASSVDPADQFFVDGPRQHHFGDLRRFRIGDAQTIDKLAFNAQFFEHGADLRPAAMHDDGVNADRFQKHNIIGKIARQTSIAHRMAAIFYDKCLARVTLQIRQSLGKRFCFG